MNHRRTSHDMQTIVTGISVQQGRYGKAKILAIFSSASRVGVATPTHVAFALQHDKSSSTAHAQDSYLAQLQTCDSVNPAGGQPRSYGPVCHRTFGRKQACAMMSAVARRHIVSTVYSYGNQTGRCWCALYPTSGQLDLRNLSLD